MLPGPSWAATTLTWDADGTVGGGTGGTGIWNTTSTFWNNAGAMQAWVNTNNDVASFAGTAGTVTLAEAITAGGLTFGIDGYTLVGNGNPLSLGGNVLVTNANTLATLQTNITQTAGLAFAITGNVTFDTGYTIAGSGFSLSKSGAGTLNLKGAVTDASNLSISAGVINLSGSYIRTATYSNNAGLTVTGGTFNVTGTLGESAANPLGQTAFSGNSITNFSGTEYLSGTGSTFRIGQDSSATVNVTGGTLTVGTASSGLALGRGANTASGFLNISGGTVSVAGGSSVIRVGAGYSNTELAGPSILTLSGTGLLDTSTTTAAFLLGSNTAGNTTGTGTLSLDGGTLATLRSITAGTVGSSTVNFNGGTIKANGAITSLLDTALTTVNVRNGGVVIDNNGFAIGIARALTHSGINGDNATDGGLTKNGLGILTLSGTIANTYTGVTLINAGELDLSKTAGVNAIAGAITLGNGTAAAILKLINSDQIADTSIITLSGSGVSAGILRLNNKSDTIGGLISTGGAGIVENESGATGTATLTVNVDSGSQTFSGLLRNGDGTGTDGTLALIKSGLGTLTLSGTNTYTGTTTINAGTLILTGTNTYAGATTINGGTLTLNAATTFSSAMTINAGTLVINNASTFSSTTTITSGGTLLINAASIFTGNISITGSTLTLNNTNTFSGSTTINSGATLVINTANTFTGGITITSGGKLQFGVNNAVTSSLLLSGAGGSSSALLSLSGYNWTSGAITFYDATSGATSQGTINIGSGVLTLGGNVTVSGTNNPLGALINGGTLDLGVANRTFAVGDSSNAARDLTIDSAITSTAGTIALTKSGLGTLLLSGSVNIGGSAIVSGGVLEVSNTFINGTSSTSVSVGTLRLITGGDYTTSTLSLGTSSANQGVLSMRGGTLKLTPPTNQGGISLGGTGYGGLFLQSGSISTARVDSLDGAVPTAIAVMQVSGGTLNTANYIMFRNERWEFTVTGGQVLRTGEPIGLAFRSTGSTTAQGAMTVAGGVINNTGLTVTIAGQNNNTALGTTYINLDAGTLITNQIIHYNGTGTANNAYVNFNGGLLQASVATTAFIGDSSSGGTGTLTGYVNGAFGSFNGGALINTAGFNVTLGLALNAPTGNGVTSVALSDGGSGYYGAPYVEISGGGGSGATAYATVDLDPASATYGKILSITISNPGIGYTSTPTVTLLGGGGSGAVLGSITTALNTSGGLTKSGLGILTISGTTANTYTGTTSVNAGELDLSKTAGLNAIAGNVSIGDGTTGAVLKLINSDQIADTSVISFNGGGANAGILRLNNKNETVGGLSSTGGAGIVENESGTSSTGTLTVNVDSGSQTFSGVLRNGDGVGTDGTLAFIKTGSGTQVLSGTNTYSGTTTVGAGVLQVGSSGSGTTGTGAVTVQTTATLLGTGIIKGTTFTASTGSTIQAGDGTAQGNYGTLTFTPASGSGALNFQAGSSIILGINPGGTSDLLNIIGTGTNTLLFNANLTVTADTFTPTAPQTFNLLDWSGLSTSPTFASRFTYTGLLTGNNDEAAGLDLPDISGSGYFWDISSFTTNGTIALVMVVPEPSRLLLLGMALGGMLFRRSRFKTSRPSSAACPQA